MDAEALVNEPLRVVQALFEADPGAADTLAARAHGLFARTFADAAARQRIPSLAHTPLHLLRPNSLVRVRCMVQDMLDPEYFLGVYELAPSGRVVCGLYQDAAEGAVRDDSPHTATHERHVLYCVPVPAETPWAAAGFAAQHPPVPGLDGAAPASGKRPVDVDGDGDGDGDEAAEMETDDAPSSASKRSRQQSDGAATTMTMAAVGHQGDLRHPLSSTTQPNCVVKVYHGAHGLKLNEVVEFFGVLTFDGGSLGGSSSHAVPNDVASMQELLLREFMAGHPSALIPRVHSIAFARLGHNNPLLPTENPWADQPLVAQQTLAQATLVRPMVVQYLASVLGGDLLAAEFMLLNLLSNVYKRVDVTHLGRLSLNLAGCPRAPAAAPSSASRCSPFGASLHAAVSALVPKSCVLPLSLTFLNGSRLQPSRDANLGRLQATALQLSNGTHMLVDETALHEGKLEALGLINIQAVRQVIEAQTVTYDIPFQALEFELDAPAIVLSEGRSMMPVDCVVPLQSHVPLPSEAMMLPAPDFFDRARLYLAVARQAPYAIEEDVSKFVEDDFVSQRQQAAANHEPKMTQQDLYLRLTMARLAALSFGESGLSPARWQYLRLLETQRRARLASSGPATAPAR